MLKRKNFLFLLTLLLYSAVYGQNNFLLNFEKKTPKDSIGYFQINNDTLFQSSQRINMLLLNKRALAKYRVEIGYSKTVLEKTSSFGESKHGVAAVNGSFFDIDKGGSVTYLETNDTVISKTRSSKFKWAKPNKLINGALIITKENNIIVEPAKPDRDYEESKKEKGVLVAGPLLLLNSKKIKLPEMKFVTSRHPRTLFCTTGNSYLFITIDGRSKEAEGMSLTDVQKYLMNLGIVDAINLDGGGSTTMWINNKGVVNKPSDATGERPVANVLLIEKSKK
ncbi:MAG: phosphodiester glycosidase family protein [Ignavibacteriales bacterium]|nr:phosphodiester glycosidase family protein [Ignavibacteriales bacterium]